MCNTLVLALGNPLRGDDGIGAAALDLLRASGRVPDGVTLLDGGTPGLELVLLLQGWQRVVIIDAAEMHGAPGTWMRFRVQAVMHQFAGLNGTLHEAGLTEALLLAEALHLLPNELTIYGMQPAVTGWECALSEPVQHALPSLCKAILHDLEE